MAGSPSTVAVATPTAPFTELSARHLGPVRRYFVRHRVAMDLVVMALYFVPSVVGIVAIGPAPTSGPSVPTVVYLALVTAGTVALFFRRRAPLVTTGVVLALFSASVLVTKETLGFDLALALAMYAVAASRPTWVSWTALGGDPPGHGGSRGDQRDRRRPGDAREREPSGGRPAHLDADRQRDPRDRRPRHRDQRAQPSPAPGRPGRAGQRPGQGPGPDGGARQGRPSGRGSPARCTTSSRTASR